MQQKIISDNESLGRILSRIRFKEEKIVFTNGCFDLLHRGHVELLAKAASLGNVLIVGLNTDNSIKRLKGNHRPLNDQQSRALMLAALSVVNYIVFFDEDTPENIIRFIKPDVLVKGSDYKIEEIVGHDIVPQYGGKVQTIELTRGYSTSEILRKIKEMS